MSKKVRFSIPVCLVLLFSFLNSYSQIFNFRNFNIEEGLPGRFVYTINQDQNGFIWLGTNSGLTKFDGFRFYNVDSPDSTSTGFAVSSLDAGDGTVYFGMSDGNVYHTVGNNLETINGIDAFRINAILEDSGNGLIFISQSKGVYRYIPGSGQHPKKISLPDDDVLFCGALTESGNLLLGTLRGLMLTDAGEDRLELIYEAPELTYLKVQTITRFPGEDKFIIGTEDDGIYVANIIADSVAVSRLTDDETINILRVQSVIFDRNGYLWISTFGDGAYKLTFDDERKSISSIDHFFSETGLSGNDVRSIYQDSEGNIWMGLFGNGISILGSDAYKFYSPGGGTQTNDIIYLDESGDCIIAGTPLGFYKFDPANETTLSFTDIGKSLGSVRITAYLPYNNGAYLLGTDGNGVLLWEKSGRIQPFFKSNNNLENFIADIKLDGEYIWLATRSGVIFININSHESRRYTTFEKLPHNSIKQIIPNGSGKVYIATTANRLYSVDPEDGVQSGKAVIYGGGRNDFQALSINSKGQIWGATLGKGIYCFSGDSVTNISTARGLLSDYCYSIFCDSKDNVWIGHEQGFSVYDHIRGQVTTFVDIFRSGADCNENALSETSEGLVLIGTTEGFMTYDRSKDQSRFVPPKTNILSVIIDNIEYPYQQSYNLPYKIRYSVRINYAGLYYSDPGKVYFKYFLDNYDTEWSESVFSRNCTYKLSDGIYRFNLMSFNYDGITNNEVASFDLTIRKPVWRMWWFIMLLIILAAGVIVIIIRYREKAQNKVKAYLESELNERTGEVIKQKEEIEFKNREITDSINYAQRIQASLLPAVSKLDEAFGGSFTFYRPRDIVSGDFYWFDQVSEDRFIMVCADSTGHGVPGAFMSMIGSALIQEIITRKEITRPSEILSTLDKEISSTLNQGDDENATSDGMDMVVCEFNQKTRMLRFASAMRPVILIMDGEQYYIRGNKSSVGGESAAEKYFDDQEYFLKEGDSIYLFSDGFPDQFGGPAGKKLKIIRLKTMIDEIKDLPMSEQYTSVSKCFDNWKGDLDQVDDVLFMGIKI
ncbi:MAG: SpoIIE family protein phosphatase [Bacteroidales bacterium]|nr:SpoIIE family protein phosphatase [Bacteroidales bacterium]